MRLERLRYLGWRCKCPICGAHLRSFAPDIWDGTRWHGEPVRCPGCDSRPRHRWLWLYLHDEPALLAGKSVLHVAPEPTVAPYVRAAAREYISADIDEEHAEVQADLTALPFEDERFDIVICSHVLEHVPDDRAAMREMHRVLAPGGIALVQTPVNYEQASTYEDPAESNASERLRRFSQADHVRVYGPDLADRLEEAGFEVTVDDATALGAKAVDRYGLRPNAAVLRNEIYSCVRSGDLA